MRKILVYLPIFLIAVFIAISLIVTRDFLSEEFQSVGSSSKRLSSGRFPASSNVYNLEIKGPEVMDFEAEAIIKVAVSFEGLVLQKNDGQQITSHAFPIVSDRLAIAAKVTDGLEIVIANNDNVSKSTEYMSGVHNFDGTPNEWSFMVKAIGFDNHTITVSLHQLDANNNYINLRTDDLKITIKSNFWGRIKNILLVELPEIIANHLLKIISILLLSLVVVFRKKLANLLGISEGDLDDNGNN